MVKYLLGTIIVLLIFLGGLYKYAQRESDRADRMTLNYKQSVNDNAKYIATYEELTSKQKNLIDKLSDSLSIKPKFIDRVVEVEVHDSIPYPVETIVDKIDSNSYSFTRDTGCFHVQGIVKLLPNKPIVTITQLEYNNTIDYVVYMQRKQWQFLFIKCRLFGRKEAKLEVISDCGRNTVQEVEIIKK